MKYKMKKLQTAWRSICYSFLMMLFCGSSGAAALTTTDINSLIEEHAYYDAGGQQDCTGSGSASLDSFLQALSYFETGGTGDPTIDNHQGAYGKYQYQDGTWASSVSTYYDAYKPQLASAPHASQAPESVQDTVAYLEYTKKAIDYNGDVAKMAISHIFPAIVDDPSKWDTTKDGNGTSGTTYIKRIVEGLTSGKASFIKLHYSETTDLQKYLDAALGGKAVPPLVINYAEFGGTGSNIVPGGTSSCACTPIGGGGKTIVLDPGHAPVPTIDNGKPRDPATGLHTDDYPNPVEIDKAYDVAQKIGAKLTTSGFNVVYTKSEVSPDNFTLDKRAKIANDAQPLLLFTIHGNDDGGDGINTAGPNDSRWLAYPDNQTYRVPRGSPRADGTNGLVHPAIIDPSKAMAEKLAPMITGSAGLAGNYKADSFNNIYGHDHFGPLGRDPGNTPTQTILSNVPSVYSEVSDAELNDSFANAVADAIIKTITPGTTTQPSSNPICGSNGGLIQTISNYAWPTKPLPPKHEYEPKQAYEDAIKAAKLKGETYFGGNGGPNDEYEGIDCGAFIIRLMHDSGADKDYAAGDTSAEKTYLDAQVTAGKYERIGVDPGASALKFGDIGVNGDTPAKSDHVYMFVGTSLSAAGFTGNAVSASLKTNNPLYYQFGKAPAGSVYYSGNFTWYRLKGLSP